MKTNHPSSVEHAGKAARRSSRVPALGGRATRTKLRSSKKPKAGPTLPHYGTGLRYDTPGLTYVGDDPVPGTPGGARVSLDLYPRTDAELAAFAEAHVAAMTGNTNFLSPTPTAPVFAAALAAFESIISEMEAWRVAMKNLTEQRDVLRANLIAYFTQRGQYVDIASNGDADIIATSALPVRRPRNPVGQLMWPTNLRVEQTQFNGVLLVRWNAVKKARGYVLQCAEVVEGEPRVWTQVYVGGKFNSEQKNLVPGKTYEFRVAALGGKTGQSDWSPVVARMAA